MIIITVFFTDVWGDAVNTASRMESYGTPDHIHITRETYEIVKSMELFDFHPQGEHFIKGLGNKITYLAKPSSSSSTNVKKQQPITKLDV